MDIAVGSINVIYSVDRETKLRKQWPFELLAFHPVKRQGEKN